MTAPEDYAEMAQQHWRTFLPSRYSQITNPETYFQELGQEIESMIHDLAAEIAGNDPPGEDYLTKVGRLNEAHQAAREAILTHHVLLPAEPGSPMDENSETAPSDATES